MEPTSILPQASLFLGLIPALVLLYISIKGYDELYQDKNLYLAFLGGLIAALIISFVELRTLDYALIIPLLWTFIEVLGKSIILNIPKLHEKRETVLYGLALGLGFGAMYIPFSIGTIQAPQGGFDTIELVLLIGASLAYVPLHGATGTLIGYGVYKGKLNKYLLHALLYSLVLPVWIIATSLLNIPQIQIIALLYVFYLYYHVTTKYLPQILDENQPRKRANIQEKK